MAVSGSTRSTSLVAVTPVVSTTTASTSTSTTLYFGKLGMRHSTRSEPHTEPTINLEQHRELIAPAAAAAAKKGEALPVVTCVHGTLLLGRGQPTVPCIVKARYVSKKADKKIRKAVVLSSCRLKMEIF